MWFQNWQSDQSFQSFLEKLLIDCSRRLWGNEMCKKIKEKRWILTTKWVDEPKLAPLLCGISSRTEQPLQPWHQLVPCRILAFPLALFAKRAALRVLLRTTSANRGIRCSQRAIARTLVSKLNPFHHSVSLHLPALLLTKVHHNSVMCRRLV